jgi:transcriptional regulator with XRE-family HTH domain
MDPRALIGRNLRHFRAKIGISQEELAHRAGIDRTYVSGLERGIRNPSLLVLYRMAAALDIRAADLLTEERDLL